MSDATRRSTQTKATVVALGLMAALLVFSGTQLVLLGLIGEYIGRTFLTVNQRPQSVVREVVTSGTQSAREGRPAALHHAR